MNLLGKEMKSTLKGLTFWVAVIFLALFLFSQLGGDITMLKKPQAGQQNYGIVQSKDKYLIQQQTYTSLFEDYTLDSFTTYPFMFAKDIELSKRELQQIKQILERASGQSVKELNNSYAKFNEKMQKNPETTVTYTMPLVKGHAYTEFKKDMQKVSKILGKGSAFEEKTYTTKTMAPMTFKQAKTAYQQVLTKDHVTGAYARTTCDYFGIILAIVPVFIAAAVMLRDQRSKGEGVIFTKSISSGKLISARYLSTVLLMLIPVLLISLHPALQSMMVAVKLNVSGDFLLFFEYIIGWLLPTILAVVGIAFLATELFGGIVAIVLQFGIWMISMSAGGSGSLTGNVGWNLIPRFNEVGHREIFDIVFHQLVWNRVLWSAVGLVCFAATIFIYDYKRKGGHIFGKIFGKSH